MTMQSGDISGPERIFAASALRRVGREEPAQDMGHREERKQHPHEEPEDETPHDIIELSTIQAGGLPPGTDRAVTIMRPPLPGLHASVPALPEHHLDLEV